MDEKESKRYSIRVKKTNRLVSLERCYCGYEEFDDLSYREKLSFEDEKMLCLEPLVEYLNGLGLKLKKDYNLLPKSQYVVAKLTEKQAEELRTQDYVLSVAKNYDHLRNEIYVRRNGKVM